MLAMFPIWFNEWGTIWGTNSNRIPIRIAKAQIFVTMIALS
jgi:hypothetical protein